MKYLSYILKIKLVLFLTGLLFISCSNSQNSDLSINSYAKEGDTKITTSTRGIEVKINENINLDFKNYINELVDNAPDFISYQWDDFKEVATIKLKNGDLLYVKNSVHTNSGIIGKWIQPNSKHDIKDDAYWLKQCKWISDRILPENDVSELCHLIKHRKYISTIKEGKLEIVFNQKNYSKWYVVVDTHSYKDRNSVAIETGYYQ